MKQIATLFPNILRIYERKSEQACIPHTPLLVDSDTPNEWQGMH